MSKNKEKAEHRLLDLRDCVSKNVKVLMAVSDAAPEGIDFVMMGCALDLEKHLRKYEAAIDGGLGSGVA